MNAHELILGGARSGKSRLAEQRALASGLSLRYIATGQALDDEMQQRINRHQQHRGDNWLLIEEPVNLAQTLLDNHGNNVCLLVDCLTLWLSNCLHKGNWPQQKKALLDTLPLLTGKVIFVSNETGLGVVPMGQISREFVDESGFLHQAMAAFCAQVTLTVAGLPMSLKPVTTDIKN